MAAPPQKQFWTVQERREDDPVAHFVTLPIYPWLCSVKLLNLGCFSSAEKHMRIVLVMERLRRLAVQTNSVIHSSSASSLSSLRLTVHPQFFRPVTFESQRLTNESHMVLPTARGCSSWQAFRLLRPCSKVLVVLFSFLCTFLVELELEFREGLDSSWQGFTASSLRNIAWCSRPWCIDGRMSTAAALERLFQV